MARPGMPAAGTIAVVHMCAVVGGGYTGVTGMPMAMRPPVPGSYNLCACNLREEKERDILGGAPPVMMRPGLPLPSKSTKL